MLFGYEVMSDPLWPHGLQPIRFLCPWDSPGKNTGVGCLSFSRASFRIRHWTHVYSNKNYYQKKKKIQAEISLPCNEVMVKEENQNKEDGFSLGKWEVWGNSTILSTNWQPDTDGSKYIRKKWGFQGWPFSSCFLFFLCCSLFS